MVGEEGVGEGCRAGRVGDAGSGGAVGVVKQVRTPTEMGPTSRTTRRVCVQSAQEGSYTPTCDSTEDYRVARGVCVRAPRWRHSQCNVECQGPSVGCNDPKGGAGKCGYPHGARTARRLGTHKNKPLYTPPTRAKRSVSQGGLSMVPPWGLLDPFCALVLPSPMGLPVVLATSPQ